MQPHELALWALALAGSIVIVGAAVAVAAAFVAGAIRGRREVTR